MSTLFRFVAGRRSATRPQHVAPREQSRRGRAELSLVVATLLAGVVLVPAFPLVRLAMGAPESGGPSHGHVTPVAVTDTVTLWQQTFTTPSGVETPFTASVTFPTGSYQYLLRVEKGPVALTKADVVFDGLKVVSLADLNATGRVERVINPTAAQGTVVTRVAGSAGASVTVSVRQLPDPTWLVFGPENYIRQMKKFLVDTFVVAGTVPLTGPHYLYLTNGPPTWQRAETLELRFNGVALAVPPDFGTGVAGFVLPLTLVHGQNILEVKVGGTGTSLVSITVRTTDAAPPALTVLSPADGLVTTEATIAVSGTVTDATGVTVAVNGNPLTVQSGNFFGTVALSVGLNVLAFTATDAASNTTTRSIEVTRTAENPSLPPDPATVAPPLDRTVATTMAAATGVW